MSSPLLECVVNVSEGRDPATLEALSNAITGVPGCHLLHRDVGYGAHRTVFTFAGDPEAVFAAAEQVYHVAAQRIDMRRHAGEHPRSGAVDVCPFVPISGLSMKDVAAGTRVLASSLAASLGLPVFLYERSASAPHRSSLAAIRRGEFEGLAEKLTLPEWQPDFGPAVPHPTLGATVLGARPFLIAWNINLAPGVSEVTARELAARLRGSGKNGVPGRFAGLRAIGWTIPEYGRCQVSCNVIDPDRVNMGEVYTACREMATTMGAEVTGSELIGLIPAKYLRAAASDGRVVTAITELGLDELAAFLAEERILEKVLDKKKRG